MCISNYSSLRGDKLKPSCRCFFSIPFGTGACKRPVCIVWVIVSDHRSGLPLLKGTWFKQGWIVIFRNHKHRQIMTPSEVENKAVLNGKTQDLHALRDRSFLCWVRDNRETSLLVLFVCLFIYLGSNKLRMLYSTKKENSSLISEPVNFLCFCVYYWLMTEILKLKSQTLCLYVYMSVIPKGLYVSLYGCVTLSWIQMVLLDYKIS